MRFILAKTITFALALIWCFAALAGPSDVQNPQGALWNLLESGRTEEARNFENHLKDILTHAPLTKLTPFGGGVSGAWFAYFPNNIVAVLKGEDSASEKAPQKEVAAYVFDRAINLNMVPVTVLRTIEAKTYSLQLYYPALPRHYESKEVALELKTSRAADMSLFDYIINNLDRLISEEHNIVNGRDGRLVGIDHARSFYLAQQYSLELKNEILEQASVDFRKKLEAVRLPEMLKQLSGLIDHEQIREFKSRFQFVKQNLAEITGDPMDHRASFAHIPRQFSLPSELESLFKVDLELLQNILGKDSLVNPIETLKRLSKDTFKEKDQFFRYLIPNWKSYSWEERQLFIKTLVEVRGRLNSRYSIPRLAEQIFNIYPEDLPLLEKSMPEYLLNRDYVHLLNRIGSQKSLTAQGRAQIKKVLWSEIGSQFMDTFFVGDTMKEYHPQYEALLVERIIYGIRNGEFQDGQAFSLVQFKGLNGLPQLLKIPNRKIRDEILSIIKKGLANMEALTEQKAWTREDKDSINRASQRIRKTIESATQGLLCESLF